MTKGDAVWLIMLGVAAIVLMCIPEVPEDEE